MINGLDLFTGIGGITLALRQWVSPVAYCEISAYCQSVLLSRMQEGDLPKAPIWDDITTLGDAIFDSVLIDIIYGGFPCQDVSFAGHGAGLEGKRSGLFFQIVSLAEKIRPSFIFLENVPAICRRGGLRVVREITELGYDCRWCVISASSFGALHRRERWFLLAHSPSKSSNGSDIHQEYDEKKKGESRRECSAEYWPFESKEHWQKTVSEMGKCNDGLPYHLDRLKALGNAVVPIQVREAFKILMGFNADNHA